jgi:type II secretory pathway predicted ATPase ExeA
MVLDYYNLKEQPFGVTPDPRYLYLSPTHREALASLSYGLRNGRGFMSIIAQPGMGKTTLLFKVLQGMQDSSRTVFLFQTLCDPEGLMRSLLEDLGVDARGEDMATMHSRLNERILAESRRGRRLVVVIDEAQNLTEPALELLRMLSNFERPGEKLMQIILAGQPQLADTLASPSLTQLRQRISIVARLKPFTVEEASLYVGHRLRVAGYSFDQPLFSPQAGAMIAKHGEGIPRNINNLCFNALSLGYVKRKQSIDEDVIREVIDDLDLSTIDKGAVHIPAVAPESRQRIREVSVVGGNAGNWRHSGAWRSKCAAALVFALTLCWPVGASDRHQKVLASQVLTAEANTSKAVSSTGPFSAIEPESLALAKENSHTSSVGNGSSRSSIGFEAGTGTSRYGRVEVGKVRAMMAETDLSQLWKQVRGHSASAELALANLYLEGNVVPKNCPQAQVLLSAASKKGNKSAEDLLIAYRKRCQ